MLYDTIKNELIVTMKTKYLPKQIIQCKSVEIYKEEGLKEEEKESFSIIKIVASDESPIERFSWQDWEPYQLIMSHETEHINLRRVENKVCLFFENHPEGFFSNSFRLGKVIKYEIENKQLILTIKLGRSDRAQQYRKDIEDGVEPGNSIGAIINTLEVVQKAEKDSNGVIKKPAILKAIDWELLEVSAVDIPANPNAGSYTESENSNVPVEKFSVQIIGDLGMSSQAKPQEKKEESGNEELAVQDRLNKINEKIDKLSLQLDYWRLRAMSFELYGVENKITLEELELDFGKPEEDIDALEKMSNEDAKIELKTIERSLIRASKKKPETRLSEQENRFLSNRETKVKPVDQTGESRSKEVGFGGKSVDEFAQSIVDDLAF